VTRTGKKDMGDAIAQSAQEVWGLLVDAVTNPGPWAITGVVLVLAVVAALMRGKLASPWIWGPALAAGAFWAYRHIPRY
jgi:hypothetical protein